MPLSACVGPAEVLDAWPESEGEAVHTSTFLGHPVACAAALAALDVMEQDRVFERSQELGARLRAELRDRLAGARGVAEVRGAGLLVGVELTEGASHAPAPGGAARVAEAALGQGVLVLPSGEWSHVVELTPPVVLSEEQAARALEVLERAVRRCS